MALPVTKGRGTCRYRAETEDSGLRAWGAEPSRSPSRRKKTSRSPSRPRGPLKSQALTDLKPLEDDEGRGKSGKGGKGGKSGKGGKAGKPGGDRSRQSRGLRDASPLPDGRRRDSGPSRHDNGHARQDRNRRDGHDNGHARADTRPAKRQAPSTRWVRVSPIPTGWERAHVEQLFGRTAAGKVTSCALEGNIAFLCFGAPHLAAKAVEDLDNGELGGKTMTVELEANPPVASGDGGRWASTKDPNEMPEKHDDCSDDDKSARKRAKPEKTSSRAKPEKAERRKPEVTASEEDSDVEMVKTKKPTKGQKEKGKKDARDKLSSKKKKNKKKEKKKKEKKKLQESKEDDDSTNAEESVDDS